MFLYAFLIMDNGQCRENISLPAFGNLGGLRGASGRPAQPISESYRNRYR